MIYLDNNASTLLSPPVRQVICESATSYAGNPSSDHSEGRSSRRALSRVRERIATLFSIKEDGVLFTSGATEANNLVLGSLLVGSRPRVVTTAVEHPSVLRPIESLTDCDTVFLPLENDGRVDLMELQLSLKERASLVSVQWANSETGAIQPIEQISEICSSHDVPLHVDAAQAVGKVPTMLSSSSPQFLTFSGHKVHAPPGVGALATNCPELLSSQMLGGGQEFGLRSGTENLLGIVALGAALDDRFDSFEAHTSSMENLRNYFELSLMELFPSIKINGGESPRVPNTSNVLFPGIDGQALVAQLNDKGIYCSQTSACSNHRPEPSQVLRALGLSEQEAYSSVRFSFSPMNTMQELDHALDAIQEIAKRLLGVHGGVV